LAISHLEGITKAEVSHVTREHAPGFTEQQREVFFRIGLALFITQATEQVMKMCLTYLFPDGGMNTVDILKKAQRRKHTLGQIVIELRKRVGIDDNFDAILDEFLDKRNTLIHRLEDVPDLSLYSAQGIQIARRFVDRVLVLNESVFNVFIALARVWQHEVNIKTPVDHLFGDIDAYRAVVDGLFFEK
jgi:hypothetical protein